MKDKPMLRFLVCYSVMLLMLAMFVISAVFGNENWAMVCVVVFVIFLFVSKTMLEKF